MNSEEIKWRTTGFVSDTLPVGAWLASDAGHAVFLLNRVDTLAGKPTPTTDLSVLAPGRIKLPARHFVLFKTPAH